jgi:nicotinamidase-related amidase
LSSSIRVIKCHFPMAHQNTLELTQSALVIIDMQEAFRTKIAGFSEIAARIAVMVEAAKLLNLPLIVTEQYPKGLGRTASEIREALPDSLEIIEKTTFSSCGVQQFERELERVGAKQVLVCGIEAHICINQTVHDLLARGFEVHLLTGCIASRQPANKKVALRKMQMSGAILSSIEMALFELMRDAKHEQFRAIQGLIK